MPLAYLANNYLVLTIMPFALLGSGDTAEHSCILSIELIVQSVGVAQSGYYTVVMLCAAQREPSKVWSVQNGWSFPKEVVIHPKSQ